MTVSTAHLDEQEKTLTLALELQQGLAMAKLLDISWLVKHRVPIVTLYGRYLVVHKRSLNQPNQEK
jgi:hypothetical protein